MEVKMKKTVDYRNLRGFNYTQPDAVNDRDFWSHYHHDVVDRDMGYARRLHLNSARIFLSYDFYKENPEQFLANVKGGKGEHCCHRASAGGIHAGSRTAADR